MTDTNQNEMVMHHYVGTKEILAHPMTRNEFMEYMSKEERYADNLNIDGYLVEYLDSFDNNHPGHDHYVSWSPKEVFEKAYRKTDGLTFGLAIEALKMGKKIRRPNPIEPDLYIKLAVPGDNIYWLEGSKKRDPEKDNILVFKQPGKDRYIPTAFRNEDYFAEDWQIIES